MINHFIRTRKTEYRIYEIGFLVFRDKGYMLGIHSVYWGVNPPQKHRSLFFAKPPLKPANCPNPPPF